MVVVYIAGAFDLFHVGHLNVLEQAKKLGDFLIVGLNTDELSKKYKRRMVIPYEQRKKILEGLEYVDLVIPHEKHDESETMNMYRVDIIVVEPDFGRLQGQKKLYETMVKRGKVIRTSRTKDISTTGIIEKIKKEF